MQGIKKIKEYIGGFRPTNRLNGDPETPHPKPSPKPSTSNTTYTSSHFAASQPRPETSLAVYIPSRKRSFDTTTIVSDDSQSQRTHKSGSRTASSSNVRELRNLPGYSKTPRARKRYRFTNDLSQNGPDSDPISIDDVADNVVQSVSSKDNQHGASSVASDAMVKRYKTQTTSRHGDRAGLKTRISAMSPPTGKRSNFNLERGTWSPDHLVQSDEECNTGVQRRSTELMRGSIPHSKFVSTKGPRSLGKDKPQTALVKDVEALAVARRIIGDGLQVRRAFSGSHRYDAATEPDQQHLTLALSEISFILHPTCQDGTPSVQHQWCTINLGKVQRLEISDDLQESQLAFIVRSSDATTDSAAMIMLEFVSSEHYTAFVKWIENHRAKKSLPFDMARTSRGSLLSKFKTNWTKVEHYKPLPPVSKRVEDAEDVRLIKYNRAKRGAVELSGQSPNKGEKRLKIKDIMSTTVPSVELPAHSGDTSSDAYAVSSHTPPWTTRPIRNTRATFVPVDRALTPPVGPSWTSQNPTWSEKWRNSVVYPATGKNRAVVDKVDIERLNEGEFLNDNLIIFYLRYLQHNLENQRKDLAERIYFHNTFFFERLKPSKSGAGINYDNVKGWTNKVDLFSKDFIVVPINEYTHWYVAIICNAPKLIASEPDEKIIKEDTENTIKASTVSTQDEAGCGAAERLSPERIVSDTVGDGGLKLAADLSRIQVKSPDMESADAGAGAHIHPGPKSPVRRKKAAKRQSIGRRYDPTMPKIITLDSLASPHSPACGYLKQYLVAEAKDKKKIDIADPGSLGMTARDLPLQQNHCDCGLYLLGYIKEFLRDPDTFISSVMQHGQIDWELDPSALRHNIRELLFALQAEQRKHEDEALEERKNRKREALRAKQQKTDESIEDRKEQEIVSSSKLSSPVRSHQPAPTTEATHKPEAKMIDASQLLHPTSEILRQSVEADETSSKEPLLEESQQSVQEIASMPDRNLSEPRTGGAIAIQDVAQTFVPMLPESSDESSSPLPSARPSVVDDARQLQPTNTIKDLSPEVDRKEAVLPLGRSPSRSSPELQCDRTFAGKRPGDHRGNARIRRKDEQDVITLDSDGD